MITPDQATARAREWLGVPFVHQGRTIHGVDCAGFCIQLFKSLDALPKDFTSPVTYARNPQALLLEIIKEYCKPTDDAVEGSLIVIQWPKTKYPSHMGYCTGENIIHSYQTIGRVVEHGYREPWLKRTHSIWKVPTVMYE